MEKDNEENKSLAEGKVPEVKVAMGQVDKEEEKEFKGLTKEELMQYSNDPGWVRIRWILFILFWIIWLAMLVASIVIIIYAPKCPSPEPKQWWQKGPIYKVDIAEFKDSDNDGVGDVQGLIDELDYLVDTGINTVYLTGPQAPEDVKKLVASLADRNMKVIVDLPEDTASFVEVATMYLNDLGVDGLQVNQNLDPEQVRSLRVIVDDASSEDSTKILTKMAGQASWAEMAPFYGSEVADNHVGSLYHLVARQSMIQGGDELTADLLATQIIQMRADLPANAWPVMSFGDVDSRMGTTHPDLVDAFNMINIILPVTPLTTFGEELGIKSAGMNWGMKSNQTKADGEGRLTHYGVYSKLTRDLRHQQTILFGDLNVVDKNDTLVVQRVKKGNPGYVMMLNLNNEEAVVDISDLPNIAENIRVLSTSITGQEFSLPDTAAAKTFPAAEVSLQPRQARVFTFVPKFA